MDPNLTEQLHQPAADEQSSSDIEDDNTGFRYAWTKWLNKKQIESYLTSFICLKVPRGPFERCFLYYKKYPKEFASLHSSSFADFKSIYQSTAKSGGGLSLNSNVGQKSKIEVKTFENPYAKKKFTQEKVTQKSTNKILSNLPEYRTMLVVNFDEEHTLDYVKFVFQSMGKIRRVFGGKLKKSKQTKSG
jgi:hypothetical protein